MKVLFLYFEFRKDISDIDLLEVGIAAALLEDNGHEVDMLYLKTPPPQDSLADQIRAFNPNIVVAYLSFDQIGGVPVIDFEYDENSRCSWNINQEGIDTLDDENLIYLLQHVVGELVSKE